MTERESVAKKLTDLWSKPGHHRVFPVNAPVKLTEFIDGRFHKKSFIGEENMRPIEAYVGKKGAVIFKFREEDSDKGHIEMTEGEATACLDGFTGYLIEIRNSLDDLLMAEHREVAKAKEDTADMEARRVANPLFGSW